MIVEVSSGEISRMGLSICCQRHWKKYLLKPIVFSLVLGILYGILLALSAIPISSEISNVLHDMDCFGKGLNMTWIGYMVCPLKGLIIAATGALIIGILCTLIYGVVRCVDMCRKDWKESQFNFKYNIVNENLHMEYDEDDFP